MKKENKGISKRIKMMFIGLLLVGSFAATAQITLPGGDDNIEDAPIDGFLSIGLIAGACIGLRKHLKGKEVKE